MRTARTTRPTHPFRRQAHHGQSFGGERLLPPDVAVPLPSVRTVLVALVLQQDAELAVAQVRPPHRLELVADQGVALRLGQPGEHQTEPELGLLCRVDALGRDPSLTRPSLTRRSATATSSTRSSVLALRTRANGAFSTPAASGGSRRRADTSNGNVSPVDASTWTPGKSCRTRGPDSRPRVYPRSRACAVRGRACWTRPQPGGVSAPRAEPEGHRWTTPRDRALQHGPEPDPHAAAHCRSGQQIS